ncbi:hypothetical protein Tco_1298740 [Tanacetum coccineum]
MDVPIQQEIPPVLYASLLDVLASVIPPQSTPTPTPLTTPIPTPPSSTIALNVTTTVPDLTPAVVQRVSILEQEVKELKEVDHSIIILALVRSHVPTVVNKHLGSTLDDTLHKSIYMDENDIDRLAVDTASKRKSRHDDRDEDPSAGSNQGKKKKRQEDKSESSKKPSASKGSSRRTNSREIETNVDQPKDDALKTSKTSNKNWFKQPPRPPTPDPEWNNVQTIRDEPEQTWFNDMMHAEKPPLTFDELMATPIDFSNFVMNRLKIDNLSQEVLLKPLPLKGRLGHLTVAAEYFFNNDLEYLNSGSEERRYTTSITKTKAVKYDLKFIEDMIPNQWSLIKVQRKLFNLKGSDLVDLAVALRITIHSFFYEDASNRKRLMRADELYKFLDRTLKLVQDKLHYRVLNFKISYNKDMPIRMWSATDQRRSRIMVNKIDKMLLERWIMQNLERLTCARKLEMDYRLMESTI